MDLKKIQINLISYKKSNEFCKIQSIIYIEPFQK